MAYSEGHILRVCFVEYRHILWGVSLPKLVFRSYPGKYSGTRQSMYPGTLRVYKYPGTLRVFIYPDTSRVYIPPHSIYPDTSKVHMPGYPQSIYMPGYPQSKFILLNPPLLFSFPAVIHGSFPGMMACPYNWRCAPFRHKVRQSCTNSFLRFLARP